MNQSKNPNRTVIYGVLKEEKERNLRQIEKYTFKIASLRRGSITIRSQSGHKYYYLRYRIDNQVKQDYIGTDESKVEEVRLELEERKRLEERIKRLRLELKDINKVVKD